MNMLIEELQSLANDPRSWIVVILMGLLALVSVFQATRCPLLSDKSEFSDDDVTQAKIVRKNIGPRFALFMMAGFGLTLLGLFMITYGVKPTIALAAMVVGIVIIQTEPAKLRIREARRQVIASRDAPQDVRSGAISRLRASYTGLAGLNTALLVCLIGGLLAF